LLGLSATPALRAFGVTLLFGIGLVWLLSPMVRPRRAQAVTPPLPSAPEIAPPPSSNPAQEVTA
jgi:hypothetical protein